MYKKRFLKYNNETLGKITFQTPTLEVFLLMGCFVHLEEIGCCLA